MDAFFVPICVITLLCLLIECLGLLLGELGVTLACRFVILLLFYLAHTLKRTLIARGLKKRSRKLLHFHSYVLFVCATVGAIFHTVLLMLIDSPLYSLCIVCSSLPLALDQYYEIEWLAERQLAHAELSTASTEMRVSLYTTCLASLFAYANRGSSSIDPGIV